MTHHQFIHRHDTPRRIIALQFLAAFVVVGTILFLAAIFTDSAQ